MIVWVYRNRHRIQLAGLVLVVAGLAVAIGIEAAAGLAIVGAAALLLVAVQPQLLAHLRSRQGRRRAPRNGHMPGADADDVSPPSRSDS
ncbi:MAG TPA: hypothetical protein VJU60_10325 [Thermoleophilaceae bacterium]|nr:hypothetical protein [Thermoleophilaceae bacterium]